MERKKRENSQYENYEEEQDNQTKLGEFTDVK